MIYKNNLSISQLRIHGRLVSTMYLGLLIIWQNVKSCFGSGLWLEDKPWLDNEGWKD